MKKSIIYLFSLVMLFVTLVGCGPKGNSEVPSEPPLTSIATPPSTSTSVDPIDVTDLDLPSNREKLAEAVLELANFGNWDVEHKNSLLSTFDQMILVDGGEISLIAALIGVLEQSGITQNELDRLYEVARDVGALIAEINNEMSEGYVEITKVYLEAKITKVINLITRFENSISERKIGVFIVTLINTASEAGIILIPENFALPSKDNAAILVGFMFDMIDAIKKQGANKIAGLIIFVRDISQVDDVSELFAGHIYSYREMITYINDFGMLLVDLANAIIPHSSTVENIVGNLFGELINVPNNTNITTFSGLKDTAILIKFVGTILRDLTDDNLSSFYMDFDAIGKYDGFDDETEDKLYTTPIARGAKIFISAFDKMSTSERNSLKDLINSLLSAFIEAIDSDIYDVSLLLTISGDTIINDIRSISTYNPDALTSQQVEFIKSTLFGYVEKMAVQEKPGYYYQYFGKSYVYDGYTVASITADFNAYLAQTTGGIYVTSLEILSASSTQLKLKVNYDYYGSNYWTITYLSVIPNPVTSSIPMTLGSVMQNTIEVWYVFVPATSGIYTIRSFDAINTDPYIGLYNASLTCLATDDDSGEGSNFELTYYLTAGETYYYLATTYSSASLTANYKIVLESLSSSSTRIFVDVTVQVTSDTLYEFIPQVSGYYYVYSLNSTGDPYVYIFNSSLQQIASDDDGGDGRNFNVSCYFNAGQSYFIQASTYNSSSPINYQLRVESAY